MLLDDERPPRDYVSPHERFRGASRIIICGTFPKARGIRSAGPGVNPAAANRATPYPYFLPRRSAYLAATLPKLSSPRRNRPHAARHLLPKPPLGHADS